MTVGDLPGHEMLEIKHPDFPLLSSCRLVCLIHFALRTDTWLALGYELEFSCTIGELVESYGADFTGIWGIGPSRAGNLKSVLAAAGYPSPLDVSGR